MRLSTSNLYNIVKIQKFLKDRIKNKFPEVLIIQPFRKCNLSCLYCNARTSDVIENETDLDSKSIIQTIKRMMDVFPIQRVHLLGGEPTLDLNLVEGILKIRNIKLGITTNLVSISDNTVSLFKACERLTVSIGAKESGRMFHNGEDSYYYVLNNIEKIKDIPQVKFRLTLAKGSMNYREVVHDIERIINNPKIACAIVTDDIGNLEIDNLIPTANELFRFEEEVTEDISNRKCVPLYGIIDIIKDVGDIERFFGCPFKPANVTLNPRGEFFVCDEVAISYKHPSYTSGFGKVGYGCKFFLNKYRTTLGEFAQNYVIYNKCVDCECFEICNGGCFIGKFKQNMLDEKKCSIRKLFFRLAFTVLSSDAKENLIKHRKVLLEWLKGIA